MLQRLKVLLALLLVLVALTVGTPPHPVSAEGQPVCVITPTDLRQVAEQWNISGDIRAIMAIAAQVDTDCVVVTVDRNRPDGISQLEVGVTHMRESLDLWGDPDSVANAKKLLREGVTFQNQHIHGFGVQAPWRNPTQHDPATWEWDELDQRIQMMRDGDATKVITLCCAPTWMVDASWDWRRGTDWNKLEWAPLPAREDDFAYLAAQVAQRYPDVQYFQVWNEFKGLWDPSTNNWDYVRYTRLYNKVYQAIKAVRPDAQIGGPYLVIEGTGSVELGFPQGDATTTPITARNWAVLTYWLEHKVGADFITIDRNIKGYHDTNTYSHAEYMALTPWFGDVVRQIKQHPGYNQEPIWYAEDYFVNTSAPSAPYPAYGPRFQSAGLASMLYHELKAGISVSLRWQPEASIPPGPHDQYLFTSTRLPGGGQPLPNYWVYKLYHTQFARGTQLYYTTSSSPDVEVLASDSVVLLINKRNTPLAVRLNGTLMILSRYEVKAVY